MKKKKVLLAALAAAALLTVSSAALAEETPEAGTATAASETQAAAAGKMEGDGFITPQAALSAYIEGLQEGDIDKMISAFAVETYAVNYDIARFIERTQMYQPTNYFVPSVSDFSVRLNIENQRRLVTETIRRHYLVLQDSPLVVGEQAGYPVQMKDDLDTPQAVIDYMFKSDDILGSIQFDGSFISPVLVNDNFIQPRMLNNFKNQADMVHAQGIAFTAAKITCEGRPYLLAMDALQYGGKWYLSAGSFTLASFLDIPYMQGGMAPFSDLNL